MYLIEKYDFINNIKVDEAMVKENKTKLLKTFRKNNYIHLFDEFSYLRSYSIQCSQETEQREIDNLTREISNFMAFQEAIYDLLLERILMPVKITNMSSYTNFNISVDYSIRNGMMKTSRKIYIGLPILEHHTYIIRPSMRNKLEPLRP